MSLETRHIAVIEDDPIMGESLTERLRLEGAKVTWWRDGESAAEALRDSAPDLVICDICLPDISGEALFGRLAAETPAPFLFVTAHSEIDQAVRLMRAGAGDYLAKPFGFETLLERLEMLLQPANEGAGRLGPSASIRHIEGLISRLAKRTGVILLTGETGSGKEVCARLIHAESGAEGPFVSVDCAALTADGLADAVAESGNPKEPGTLFLDEVAELPEVLQARLLRLAEALVLGPIGASVSSLPARIICSTNADLSARVTAGSFRRDLYFRLNSIEIAVPPLRERQEDVPWLMSRIIADLAGRHGRPTPAISPAAELVALRHDWPGNVRELRNRIERALLLGSGTITPAGLFPQSGDPRSIGSLAEARALAERLQIERALEHSGGSVPDAADLLGVSRSTLFEKLKKLGIDR